MSFLDKARNLAGKPLGPDVRYRITAFINAPTAQAWDDIHKIVVYPSLRCGTVWQAVAALSEDATLDAVQTPYLEPADPRRPKMNWQRWKNVPDAFTVARAIKVASEQKPEQKGAKNVP